MWFVLEFQKQKSVENCGRCRWTGSIVNGRNGLLIRCKMKSKILALDNPACSEYRKKDI